MPTLQCLYVEHEARGENFAAYIKNAWEKHLRPSRVDVVWVLTTKEARAQLERPVDILVVDLLFPDAAAKKETSDDVIPLIEAVRTRTPDLPIVVLSKGTRKDEKDVRVAGADAFAAKEIVAAPGGLRYLAEKIEEAFRVHGKESLLTRAAAVTWDATDSHLAAIVEQVGAEMIGRLLTHLNDDIETAELVYIGGGWSGALLIGADCVTQPNTASGTREQIRLVLKISRDQKALQDELESRKQLTKVAPNLFVEYVAPHVASVGHWHAIASAKLGRVRTALAWLVAQPSCEDVERVLESLFLRSSLHQLYVGARANESSARTSVVALTETVLLPRINRIRAALADIQDLVNTYAAVETAKMARVNSLLDGATLNFAPLPSVPSLECRSHGDLHLRNVVIEEESRPYLIDGVNSSVAHWSVDVARLLVDTIVSAIDPGADAHRWERIDTWRTILQTLLQRLPGGEIGAAIADGTAGGACLTWILDHLLEIQPASGGRIWELKLALAFEFLRLLYRVDLAAPKKVFAVWAAGEVLHDAVRAAAAGGADGHA